MADVRTIMATGDNMLTALSVGKKCQIIDSESTVYLGEVAEIKGQNYLYWDKIVPHSE